MLVALPGCPGELQAALPPLLALRVKALLFPMRLKYISGEFSWQKSLCLTVICLRSKMEETALLEKVLHKVPETVKYNY